MVMAFYVLLLFAGAVALTYHFAYWRGFRESLKWTHRKIVSRLGKASYERYCEAVDEEYKDANNR